MRFASEVTTPVTVEVVSYTPPAAGRYGDRPERCTPAEGADVELAVTLGAVDVTDALSAELLEALRSEALDLLER